MTTDEYKAIFHQKYRRTSSFSSGIALMIVDCITIMLCICTTFFIINAVNHSLINFRSFVTYSIYLPFILIVFYFANLYPGIMLNPADEVRHLAICSTFSFIGIAVSISVESDERTAIIIALILAAPVAAFLLPAMRELSRHMFAKRSWWGVPAVIYASGDSGDFVVSRLLKCPNFGYKPAVIINSEARQGQNFKGVPIFSNSDEVKQMIRELGIKVAILCDYTDETPDIRTNYRYTIYLPKVQPIIGNMHARELGGILGFSITHNLTKPECLLAKRAIDIFLLIVSSPLVIPLTLIIGLAVKFTSKGPVFYGHKRVGKDGKEIKCWKFRSMVVNADKMLDKILAESPEMRLEWEKDRKFTNDPRVTKLGKFLRRSSLDEIPQLWNILFGEMSFVGPRPVTESELDKYGKFSDFILSVKPGLSGMWQISGRSDTGYEERITLDTYYIQNWSVWLDIWIIIKTIWVVLKGKGAY
ncbi:undecaprenyl-phosphate galactose phosphotransferase WbaP [Treponema parvum]|uniref:Undecaprenyl-phosphate galactose phosphotransferase WbaP n=1 Tax=Treponema parvum TaxID=138851 RepID=A0A975EZQ9_9SPIR|nr:undecaprenyl-phosphate galactose phosphotransferase WbaP [Treponema parvum]QTQ11762.1 undecaprenyl-phosphate galactose phosphotransferase WbaP [Treponema parvum]QTQ16292.1 undecaprenyl-phosphate galactose phosphotransferase WbaP [Treponema parvum]